VAYQLSCNLDDVLMMTHHATRMCTDAATSALHEASNMVDFVCQPFDEAYLDTGCNAVTCSLQFTCMEGTVTNHLYQSADCTGTPLYTMPLADTSPGDCVVSEGVRAACPTYLPHLSTCRRGSLPFHLRTCAGVLTRPPAYTPCSAGRTRTRTRTSTT